MCGIAGLILSSGAAPPDPNALGTLIEALRLSGSEPSATRLAAVKSPEASTLLSAHAALAQGQWKRSAYTGTELFEKTIGIIGLGRIGALITARLQAFGMRVVAFDPYIQQHGAIVGVGLADGVVHVH